MANSYLEDEVRCKVPRFIDSVFHLMDNFRVKCNDAAASSWAESTDILEYLSDNLSDADRDWASEALRYQAIIRSIISSTETGNISLQTLLVQWNYACTAINLAGAIYRLNAEVKRLGQSIQVEDELLRKMKQIQFPLQDIYPGTMNSNSMAEVIEECSSCLDDDRKVLKDTMGALDWAEGMLTRWLREIVDEEKRMDVESSYESEALRVKAILRIIGMNEATRDPDSALKYLVDMSIKLKVPTPCEEAEEAIRSLEERQLQSEKVRMSMNRHTKERTLVWQVLPAWEMILRDQATLLKGEDAARDTETPVVESAESATS